jgi:hypothetical protein
MAGKREKTEERTPVFVLRADKPGHIRALMAAAGELPDAELREALERIREFELYEEAHR